MISRIVLPLIFICSTGVVSYAEQPASPCQLPATYVGKGDVTSPVEYEPISVTVVGGRVSGVLMAGEAEGVSGVCLALFTERKHNFVAGAVTDKGGEFLFSDIPAGRYRLVVRAAGFYVADIPVRVQRKAKASKSLDIVLQSVVMQQQRGGD
jgi:hypothetical protein